jgi:hypothetical protein
MRYSFGCGPAKKSSPAPSKEECQEERRAPPPGVTCPRSAHLAGFPSPDLVPSRLVSTSRSQRTHLSRIAIKSHRGRCTPWAFDLTRIVIILSAPRTRDRDSQIHPKCESRVAQSLSSPSSNTRRSSINRVRWRSRGQQTLAAPLQGVLSEGFK